MITASDLFALAHTTRNIGIYECHWCASKCDSSHIHDDVIPMPFVRSPHPCRRPANSYVCNGCWLWRRQRITVRYYSGGLKDSQTPENYSWLITEKDAWVIESDKDFEKLYTFLLKPSGSFALSFLQGDKKPRNYIQEMVGNDLSIIKADTPITYTINNIKICYTIYELTEALKNGDLEGKEPGVRALLGLCGKKVTLRTNNGEHRGRGRPKKEEDPDGRIVTKEIHRSGSMEKIIT